MARRPLLLAAFVLLLALSGARALSQGQDEGRPALVGGAVHLWPGTRGGNVGLQVGEDGLLLVDDKFPDTTDEIRGAMRALGHESAAFLVNTHHHGDHTGGNATFGKEALVVAHANVRARLVVGREPAEALPVVTYEAGASLHVNGEEVRLLHVPGAHTDGDTVVWFTGSNVVHMGDLYFQVGYPFVDTGSGGNAVGLLEGIDRVLERIPEDVRVIPGHGEVTGVDGLREYRAMIETVVERVRELVAEGFTDEEVLEAGVTEEFDERWNWGFVDGARFVSSVLASLR